MLIRSPIGPGLPGPLWHRPRRRPASLSRSASAGEARCRARLNGNDGRRGGAVARAAGHRRSRGEGRTHRLSVRLSAAELRQLRERARRVVLSVTRLLVDAALDRPLPPTQATVSGQDRALIDRVLEELRRCERSSRAWGTTLTRWRTERTSRGSFRGPAGRGGLAEHRALTTDTDAGRGRAGAAGREGFRSSASGRRKARKSPTRARPIGGRGEWRSTVRTPMRCRGRRTSDRWCPIRRLSWCQT